MSINELDNTGMAIQVSETSPGSSGIKIEPKEEDCEDLLSAFLVDPPPVKIEKDEIDDNRNEYGTLSEDYSVNIEKLKAEHSEDSNECLIKPPIKSEENDQDQDQDDAFTEDSNIKNEEMDIKEDDESIDEPGNSPNSYDEAAKKICTRKKRIYVPRQCLQCEFNTTRKRDMTRHLAQHKRKQEYSCPKCDYRTTKKARIRAHLHRHNKIEQAPEYNCDICEYTTAYKSRIERHFQAHPKREEHTQQTMFECSQCDFKTKYKNSLKRHSLVHEIPENEFACPKCDFVTAREPSLKVHLFRHISSDEATEYNCDICEYTTLYKGHIDRHLQAHTTKKDCTPQTLFKCSQCDFKTKSKYYYLKVHSHVHENCIHRQSKDMFKCYQCSYETEYKKNLIRHLQRHRVKSEMMLIEEHPRLKCESQNAVFQQTTANLLNSVDNYMFKCQHCDYKTNWSSSFTTHLKQHDKPKKKRAVLPQ